jgi:hypothetical protein
MWCVWHAKCCIHHAWCGFWYNTGTLWKMGARIAHWVQRLVMSWTTGELCFDSQQGEEIFLFYTMSKTDSGAHEISYLVSSGDSFPGIKRQRREATSFLQLVESLRTREAILPLPRKSSWRSAELNAGETLLFLLYGSCSTPKMVILDFHDPIRKGSLHYYNIRVYFFIIHTIKTVTPWWIREMAENNLTTNRKTTTELFIYFRFA